MSFARKKVVIDSNILVSAAIYPHSASANALRLAVMFANWLGQMKQLLKLSRCFYAQNLTVTLPPADPPAKTF